MGSKFNAVIYQDNKLLFFNFFQHSLDFSGIHTLKLHLESTNHKNDNAKILGQKQKDSIVKQTTLEATVHRAEKLSEILKELNENLLLTLPTANIPVE